MPKKSQMPKRGSTGPLSPTGKKQILKIPKESRMEVQVYYKPTKRAPEIKFVGDEIQGMWADNKNVHTNPCLLWAFPQESVPEGLEETEHTQGVWGYSPDTTPPIDPKSTEAEEMVFFSPLAKLPSAFTPLGIWTFPLIERNISHLKDYETAFLPVGKAVATEKMDVAGTWKLLYKNDGSDQPIGPGMNSKNEKSPSPQNMNITVRTPEGKTIDLDVMPTDTPDDVKNMLRDKEKIPKHNQRLMFDGKELDDDRPLKEQKVKDGDLLDLDPMQIFVKHWDGTVFPLLVRPTEPIDVVKKKIEKHKNIPKSLQRLRFRKTPLSDGNLEDYGIKHKDTIELEPMIIKVQTLDGETIPLQVEPDDTIEDVKRKVKKASGIPVPDQTLLFEGDTLDDPNTLDDYGIQHGDTLELEPMEINVKHWDGTVMTLGVEVDDTIDSIKTVVAEEMEIPKDQQILTYKGKLLKKNKKTLRDYKIKNKSTLILEPMHVNVETPGGKVVPIGVAPGDTIADVKNSIEDKIGIPVPHQKLLFEGEELDDNPTLSDYNIKNDDTLKLDPMMIYVKKPDGTKVPLTVSPSNTIADVKDMVEDKEGIPTDDQQMEFKGNKLEDYPTLFDSSIKDGDIIDLVPMEIIVRHWNNAIFYFEVDPDFTIDQIKDLVQNKPPKIKREEQKMKFKDEPLLNDDDTLRDCDIKHKDIIQLVKPPKKEEVKKSYLPENWREEVEKKYGHVKTTTYKTDYSGDNDKSFIQGKIRETETEFEFSEERTLTNSKGQKKTQIRLITK